MGNYLFCIVGRSGSGKTTVTELLERKYEFSSIKSFTDRPKRNFNEKGHIFVTSETFPLKENLVAYNVYNGYQYGTTIGQVENNDIYIVDIPGLQMLKQKYHGKKTIIAIGLDISPKTSFKRMLKRGDSVKQSAKRLLYDNKAFKNLNYYCDFIINSDFAPHYTMWYLEKVIDNCLIKPVEPYEFENLLHNNPFFRRKIKI